MTHRHSLPRSRAIALLALLALGPAPLAAQLPSASALAVGTGDNFTALARGFSAVAWNPAGLALSGNPRFSFTVMAARLDAGFFPITLGDLKDYEGDTLPPAVKSDWLDKIAREGGQRGTSSGGVSYLAMSIGRLGFQFARTSMATANLTEDFAEVVLYGNAGRTGTPRDYRFAGSSADAFATSTAALSHAQQLPFRIGSRQDQRMAVGATVKYVIGHGVAHAQDNGSFVTDDSIHIRFPVIATDSVESDWNNGNGVGLDLGLSWEGGPYTLALTVQNVVNTFQWDETKLFYRPGTATYSRDTSFSDFDSRPLSEKPASLPNPIPELKYHPTVTLGFAWRTSPEFVLSADLRQRLGDSPMESAMPESHYGVGAEYRPFHFLPLRAGGAAISGGYQLAGGAGLQFGWFNLTGSAMRRFSSESDGLAASLAVSFGAR